MLSNRQRVVGARQDRGTPGEALPTTGRPKARAATFVLLDCALESWLRTSLERADLGSMEAESLAQVVHLVLRSSCGQYSHPSLSTPRPPSHPLIPGSQKVEKPMLRWVYTSVLLDCALESWLHTCLEWVIASCVLCSVQGPDMTQMTMDGDEDLAQCSKFLGNIAHTVLGRKTRPLCCPVLCRFLWTDMRTWRSAVPSGNLLSHSTSK